MTAQRYRFPIMLREDFHTEIYLPEDLTVVEAEYLASILRSLAVLVGSANPDGASTDKDLPNPLTEG